MVCKAHLLGDDISEINTIVFTHTLAGIKEKNLNENLKIKYLK